MKNIFDHMKKFKKLAIIGAIVLTGTLTVGFTDSYFEISKNLEIFTTLYRELNIYYVDETEPGELMKTGIDAMLESLDPYTTYIAESDIEDYRFMTTGQYGGIGSLIRKKDDVVVISEPYEGFPAQKAGLRAGDKILEVDGKSVVGKNTNDVSSVLKGQAGTDVVIKVERPGVEEPFDVELTREEIKIPDVPYYGFLDDEKKTGYIKLTSFTHTASAGVRSSFKELKADGMERLVFDLRGNGGGLLREAVNIVNLFVPKNQLVVNTKGRIKDWDKTYKTLNEPIDKEMPIIVLVDGSSASASEIVSGALQDLDRAVIVGKLTYGKGLVQQTRELYYNSKLKLTVAKYYIPSGRCIQKVDYSHRDGNGKAIEVADSLIAQFETKNGRPVFDGRGILPDVDVEDIEMGKIVSSIGGADLFFEYANKYRSEHDSILPVDEFEITDEMYADIVAFFNEKDFEHHTRTMDRLDDLKEMAEKEKYFDDASVEFEALKAALTPKKENDLIKFKDDIEMVIKNELIARYYFQTGRVQASLETDPYIERSFKVFDEEYAGVLDGSLDTNEKSE